MGLELGSRSSFIPAQILKGATGAQSWKIPQDCWECWNPISTFIKQIKSLGVSKDHGMAEVGEDFWGAANPAPAPSRDSLDPGPWVCPG